MGERRTTRAAVEAEAESMAGSYPRQVVDTACQLKDYYDLLTAEDFEARAQAAAGMVHVGQVRSLIEELREANSSGEKLRIYAVAAVCQSTRLGQ